LEILSYIKDFLTEEKFFDQAKEAESEDEVNNLFITLYFQRRSEIQEEEDKNHDLLALSSINRITSHQKTFALTEEETKEEQLMSNEAQIKGKFPAKRMTQAGFDFNSKRDFEKEIKIVDSLINGTYKGPMKSFEDRKIGYKILKNGGIECVNREELKAQEGLVLELMKTAGKTLMEGKNVVGISLPVRIFEPRSTIERICDGWSFGPIYLNRASKTTVRSIPNILIF